MVAYFGFSKKVGNISFYDSSGQQDYAFNKPFSEKTNEIIDTEVKAIVEQSYERAVKILTENRKGLEKLAAKLLEKEVIFGEDLENIFGKRPWGDVTEVIKDNKVVKKVTRRPKTKRVIKKEEDLLDPENKTGKS